MGGVGKIVFSLYIYSKEHKNGMISKCLEGAHSYFSRLKLEGEREIGKEKEVPPTRGHVAELKPRYYFDYPDSKRTVYFNLQH